jgi:pyroglutamyl-peptidase
MMKILLSGFEPFGESAINPSQMLVDSLVTSTLPNIDFHAVVLPVDRDRGPATLLQAVDVYHPDVVLSFGLAMGRAKISLERVALNLMDFRIPDNAGAQAQDEPVIPGGPAAYFSTLPLRNLYKALVEKDIPVELSLSAGSYLCNQVYYALMHAIAAQQKPIRAGFIHLPALPEQAAIARQALPSMSFETMHRAVETIMNVLMAEQA